MLDRGFESSQVLERQAEIVVGFCMLGPQLDGSLQGGKRSGEIPRPPARGAEVVLRIEQAGIELDRLFESADGLTRLPLLPEHEAKSVAGLGHLWRVTNRLHIRRGSGGEILLTLFEETEEEMSFG